jgi:hypothetical protein
MPLTGDQRFAVADLLAEMVFNQPLQLSLRGRALPDAREPGSQMLKLSGCDDDTDRLRGSPIPYQSGQQEEADANRQKVDERLPQHPQKFFPYR